MCVYMCLCLHQERILLFIMRSCIDMCADRSAVCALLCKGVVVCTYLKIECRSDCCFPVSFEDGSGMLSRTSK